MRILAPYLLTLLFVGATTAQMQAQENMKEVFVCFYTAPMQKSINIMFDVYQGIAHSHDGGDTWKSEGYKTSLYNNLTVQPETGYLYASSEYGVMRSTDNGTSWKQLTGWDIQTVFRVDFQGNNIWIATPRGPAVSKDDGLSWTLLTKGLKPLNATYVSDLTVDGNDIVISTADGLYLSTNGGASWEAAGLQGQEIDRLIRHPKDAGIIAAIHHGEGIWLSRDNGRSWERANGDLHSTKVQTLTFDPVNPDIIYAGMSDYPVCKSTDGGRAWTTWNKGLTINNITALSVDPVDVNRIYAGTENGLWVSKNGGAEWERSNIRFGYVTAINLKEAL